MIAKIHQATLGNISEILKGEKPVIVDFWANWCAPCHAVTPTLKKIAKKFQDQVTVAKVDIDSNRDLASQFQITSLPTLVFFKSGKEWDRITGAKKYSEIEKIVQKLIR